MNTQVIDFIQTHRDRYIDELKQWLPIPSISALPEHAPDVRRAAEWAADEMRRIGLQGVRLIETPGNPVAYGEWLVQAPCRRGWMIHRQVVARVAQEPLAKKAPLRLLGAKALADHVECSLTF